MASDTDTQDTLATANLTELQLAIMRVVWNKGQATIAEIAKSLADTRPLAHTTVSTVLTRLEKRGVVHSCRSNRQLVYTAKIGRPETRRALVASFVDRIFAGDPKALVAHLIHENALREDDVREMAKLIAEGRGK